MAREPASYRAGTAGFDLNAGSAIKAILPGAFQAAFVGSLFVAAYFSIAHFADLNGFTMSDALGVLMGVCFIVMIATFGGTVMCALYITLIGLPLALLMRRHIVRPATLWISVAVAAATGSVLAGWFISQYPGSPQTNALTLMAVIGYAIPAGYFYRRAIITERMLSFWSQGQR